MGNAKGSKSPTRLFCGVMTISFMSGGVTGVGVGGAGVDVGPTVGAAGAVGVGRQGGLDLDQGERRRGHVRGQVAGAGGHLLQAQRPADGRAREIADVQPAREGICYLTFILALRTAAAGRQRHDQSTPAIRGDQ